MKEIIKIETISESHNFLGLGKPKHPLISVIRIGDVLKNLEVDNIKYSLGLYQISLKDNCPFTIVNYGRNSYDYQEGTMVFTAPNQVLEFKKAETAEEDQGWTLAFHPDLIRKSELGKKDGQLFLLFLCLERSLACLRRGKKDDYGDCRKN